MFDFVQTIFAKITTFVVGVVAAIGLATPTDVQPNATTTEQSNQIQETLATSSETQSEIETLKREAETAQLRAGKAEADAAAARAEVERQKLQAENQQLKAQLITPTQPPVQPTPTPVSPVSQQVKDYRFQAISRLNSIIALEESMINWFQDTSDQFRAASLTLSSYSSVGGLYGEARELAIEIANKEVGVISSLISYTRQDLSRNKAGLDLINQNPTQVVGKSTLDLIPTPEKIEADFDEVKKGINEQLDQVLGTLQYH